MDPVALATLAFGYTAQFAKAHPRIPSWVVDVVQLAIGAGIYMLGHPPVADYIYVRDCIVWAFALPGLSSTAGHAGFAPKTVN